MSCGDEEEARFFLIHTVVHENPLPMADDQT